MVAAAVAADPAPIVQSVEFLQQLVEVAVAATQQQLLQAEVVVLVAAVMEPIQDIPLVAEVLAQWVKVITVATVPLRIPQEAVVELAVAVVVGQVILKAVQAVLELLVV